MAGEGDVVIGREQGDQPEGEAADGLGEAQPVEAEGAEAEATVAEPGGLRLLRFWRTWWIRSVWGDRIRGGRLWRLRSGGHWSDGQERR